MTDSPPLHPDCAPLACLLGTWRGPGSGHYPSIAEFGYVEEITFDHVGKPFLSMIQRTRDSSTNEPLHAESGYLRAVGNGSVELIVAQPSGIVEIDTGKVSKNSDGIDLDLESVHVAVAPTAKSVTATRRLMRVAGDEMVVEMWMAAVGHPLTHHLRSELTRFRP